MAELMLCFLFSRYAKVEISASSPIVPFRETIIPPPTMDMVNESILEQQTQVTKSERWKESEEEEEEVIEEGVVKIYTRGKSCMIQVRAVPLPPEVTDILENSQFLIKMLDQYISACVSGKAKAKLGQSTKLKESTKNDIREFKDKLEKAFTEAGKQWKDCVNKIWAFGPRRVGPNLLLNKVEGYNRISVWKCLDGDLSLGEYSVRDYDTSISSGFQLATLTGPLCEEPLRGVCFIVEKWDYFTDESSVNSESNPLEMNNQTDTDIGNPEATSESHIGSLEINLENVHMEESDSVKGQGESESCDINQTESTYLSQLSQPETSVTDVTDVSACEKCDREAEYTENKESLSELSPSGTKINRQRSKISESGSIHDLEFEKSNDLDLDSDSDDSDTGKQTERLNLSGQLISISKEACRKAFQTQPQRLMVAMYKCTVQCTTEALGKILVSKVFLCSQMGEHIAAALSIYRFVIILSVA